MSYRKRRAAQKQRQTVNETLAQVDFRNPGDQRLIPANRLISGLAYQRPVKPQRVHKILQMWDERLLDPVVVSFRDGKYYVVDGQHRITAMATICDSEDFLVPCIVYTGMTYEQEAELCVKLDKAKKNLSMAQSTNATLESRTDPKINQISRILNQAGFSWQMNKERGKDYEITVTQAVINAYDLIGLNLFTRMMNLLALTWHGAPASLSAAMLSGMALFLKTYETEFNDASFVQRFSPIDPSEIIRRGNADFSTNNKSLRIAKAMLERFNKAQRGGRKLRYRFDG